MADNKIFRVNGAGIERLKATLKLAFSEPDHDHERNALGWVVDKEHGLIFMWTVDSESNCFPVAMGADQCAEIAMRWLDTEEAKQVTLDEMGDDCDHDGHNTEGWLVYVENWGHVGGNHYALCAVKPCFMWHGK